MNILQKKYYEYRYRNLFNVEEVLNVKIPKIIEFNNNLLGNSVIEPITEFSICNCIDLLRSISDAYILSIFSQIHIIPYTFVSSHNNISDEHTVNQVSLYINKLYDLTICMSDNPNLMYIFSNIYEINLSLFRIRPLVSDLYESYLDKDEITRYNIIVEILCVIKRDLIDHIQSLVDDYISESKLLGVEVSSSDSIINDINVKNTNLYVSDLRELIVFITTYISECSDKYKQLMQAKATKNVSIVCNKPSTSNLNKTFLHSDAKIEISTPVYDKYLNK